MFYLFGLHEDDGQTNIFSKLLNFMKLISNGIFKLCFRIRHFYRNGKFCKTLINIDTNNPYILGTDKISKNITV